MATTTPNFGWSVPTSSDLVKNGAVAIETLGDSIDASLVDLKGGTTGQVLAKATNTDMDFSWVAQDDSNAIQNAIVDAKGDLIAATAADTPDRLAVGTNGQVLTADSTAATGLAYTNKGWTLISTTSLSGASVTLSSIPQTYQSLKLVVTAVTNATADGRFQLRPNNTTTCFLAGQENTTNYSIVGTVFQTQANLLRTGTDNLFVFNFDKYTDTHNEKSMTGNYFYVSPDIAGFFGGMYYGGSGISSLVLSNTGGNLNGGTALLYGVA
jgi:hypothetical protein